jgi:hypothetical protein
MMSTWARMLLGRTQQQRNSNQPTRARLQALLFLGTCAKNSLDIVHPQLDSVVSRCVHENPRFLRELFLRRFATRIVWSWALKRTRVILLFGELS